MIQNESYDSVVEKWSIKDVDKSIDHQERVDIISSRSNYYIARQVVKEYANIIIESFNSSSINEIK